MSDSWDEAIRKFAEDPAKYESEWKAQERRVIVSVAPPPYSEDSLNREVEKSWIEHISSMQYRAEAIVEQNRLAQAQAETRLTFARGKWPDKFETLAEALNDFTGNHRGPYGKHGFHFAVVENTKFTGQARRAWWLTVFNPNWPEVMFEKKPVEAPEDGWPNAEVLAREVPGGLKVELLHNGRQPDALQDYLGRLLDALIEDGLVRETPQLTRFDDLVKKVEEWKRTRGLALGPVDWVSAGVGKRTAAWVSGNGLIVAHEDCINGEDPIEIHPLKESPPNSEALTTFQELRKLLAAEGMPAQPAASGAASPIAPAVVPQVTRIEHADTVQVFEAGSQQINKAQTGNVNIMSDNDANIGRDVAGRDKKESTQVGKREADE